MDRGDTIFALATARGKAGLSVFRVSGPTAHEVASRLCGALPGPRHASVRRLVHEGDVIDEALVLAFEAGASFTGETTVEFQVHGSMAVVRRLESALAAMPGCRAAGPGEFTRRALENGRLDLTQVEGLADVIEAETEAQLRQAQRALAGELRARVEAWRERLLRASALAEAAIDFSDEELPAAVMEEARGLLQGLVREWQREAAAAPAAERIREGFEVAIVGAPNAGKSTLINAIARRDVAITSGVPGTTRDVIEVHVDLGGLPVTLLDTAGVRRSEDEIETLGVERTKDRAMRADLRVFLDDSLGAFGLHPRPGDIRVHGKCDLAEGPGLNVSGKTGAGIAELLERVQSELAQRVAGSGLVTRERHRLALNAASAHVAAALERTDLEAVELIADELRAARLQLDALVGRVDVEDILGHIFSSFCIGK